MSLELKHISSLKIYLYILKKNPKYYVNNLWLDVCFKIWKKNHWKPSPPYCVVIFKPNNLPCRVMSLRFMLNKFAMILLILSLLNQTELLNIQGHVKDVGLIFPCLDRLSFYTFFDLTELLDNNYHQLVEA